MLMQGTLAVQFETAEATPAHQEVIFEKIWAVRSPGTCAACSCASRRAIAAAWDGSAISLGSMGR